MLLLGLPSAVMAQTVTNWATWTIPTVYPFALVANPHFGYAAGTTGSVVDPQGGTVNLTISGEVMNQSQSSFNWPNYPGIDRDAYVSDASPTDVAGNGLLVATGDTLPQYMAHTLSFGQDVTNAVMPIYSLGRPGIVGELTFSQPFVVLSANDYLTPSGDAEIGYKLAGLEGNGVIQFLGTYDTISWVVTGVEIWHGLTTPDNPDALNVVAVYDIFGDGTGVIAPPPFGTVEPDPVPEPEPAVERPEVRPEPKSVLQRVLARIDAAENLAKANGTFANIAENIGGVDGSGIDGSINNIVSDVSAATHLAAADAGVNAAEVTFLTADLGNMAATTLGAVNTGEIALSVNARVDKATTRATPALSLRIAQLGGGSDTGAIVLNVAANMTGGNGAIANSLTAANGATGNLSTTVLGAVNTGSIASGVNATVQGIVGMGS